VRYAQLPVRQVGERLAVHREIHLPPRGWDEERKSATCSSGRPTAIAGEHPPGLASGDENRSVVIVPPTEYANWLSSKTTGEARSFLTMFPVESMHAEPLPLPPRKPKSLIDNSDQESLL
jgi:hypothetical protein